MQITFVLEFSEADPDLIEFLNDFYAKLLRFTIYGNFIKKLLFLSFQTFSKVLINNLKLNERSRHQIPKLSLHPYY